MKPEKCRELTREELERMARDLGEELFNLRFRVSTQKLDDPLRLRHARRDLARILTILKEDEIGKTRLPGSADTGSGRDIETERKKEETKDEGDRKED
jgi:large subunit ribosomal protein L29